MPDLSADRPLPLPEDRIEALVREHSAAAIRNYATPRDVLGFLEGNAILEGYSSIEELTPLIEAISGGMYRVADAIEAGAALPPSAEHREEIGVRVDVEHPRRKEKAGTIMTHFPRENALRAHEIWDGWTVVRRTKIDWAGPWVEVDRSTTDA